MIFPRVVQKAAMTVAVFAISALALTACGVDSPDKLKASAKDYIQKRDYNAAIIQLKNVLKSAPNDGEARLLIGEAYIGVRDPVSAEKELQRALELGQPLEKALPPFVMALLEQRKYDAIISEVEKRNLFNPTAVAATRTALGDAYAMKGNLQAARAAYETALQAVPGHPRAQLGEAMLIAAEGRLDDALKQIDQVAAADPELAEARALQAEILLAKGDRPGARKALETAIVADANFIPVRLSLIRLLTSEREFDAAAKLIDSTRKVAPRDLRVTYLDASLAYRKGDLERARQQLQEVLRVLPDNVPSLVLLGTIDLKNNQLITAEANLRRGLARMPSHYGARQLLAQTYLAMGQPERAKETLRPLIGQGTPRDPRLLLLAGETYLASGDVKQATDFYQALSTKGESNEAASAKTRLGQLALATGRTEEGFKELEAASELGSGQHQADLAIIAGHMRRNELDKAMAAVQALEKKQPKNPLTFQMYGIVHLAKKDVPAARRNFEKALELQPSYLQAARSLAMLDVAEKRPEDARKRFELMIAKDQKNDQLYLALAELQSQTGMDQRTLADTIQRAVTANPQSVGARLTLINLYLRNKDNRAALSAAQSAAAALPNNPPILDALGVAQEAAGETNQAIETYTKLASLQPQSPQPLYRLAALHARQKETDKAVETLRRVQKIVPQPREVIPQIAEVLLAANRVDDAFKEARDLQKRDPKFSGGFSLEGDIYLAQHKFSEAESVYREALKRAPNSTPLALRLHGTLLAARRAKDADGFAKKWLADNPKDSTIRTYLGERELALKNFKAAAAYYEAAVAIDQNDVVALNSLAWIGGELGDPKALSHAARAVRLAPNDGAVLDTYGVLLLKKGETAKALPALERARELAPERNDIRLNYAKALIKAGRKDVARKELEALATVKQDFSGKSEVADLIKGL